MWDKLTKILDFCKIIFWVVERNELGLCVISQFTYISMPLAQIIRHWLQNCLTATYLKVCVCVGWGEGNGALCLCIRVCAPRATLGCFLFPCLMSAGMPLNNLRCSLLGFLCMPTSSLVDNPTLNSRAESRTLQQWWGPVSPLDNEEWSSCLNWYSLAALLCMGLYCCTCLKRCVPYRSIKTTSGIMVCSFWAVPPSAPCSLARGALVGILGLWSWCFSFLSSSGMTLRENLGFPSRAPLPAPHFWSEWLSIIPEALELPWGVWLKTLQMLWEFVYSGTILGAVCELHLNLRSAVIQDLEEKVDSLIV